MLLNYSYYLCIGSLWLTLIIIACAGYAYRVNARRPADDPKKRDFHPGAIFLAPVTWPFFLFGTISLFFIRAMVYGMFLILFTIALVVIRKPFLFIWLDKIATWVGNRLLVANTYLIRIALGDRTRNPQTV